MNDEDIDLTQLKGTRDFLPRGMILRKKIIRVLEDVFKLYGFNPAQTTILQKWNILASKYGGGAEILKETYNLTDQGDRELGLRYDLTVPFAKLIGQNEKNPQIRMPFKRYEIGSVFRDGPVSSGRVREFTQCDVDVVGSQSQISDAELVAIAKDVFKRLNVPIYIEFNNRKILSAIIKHVGISSNLVNTSILSIDKLKKIGRTGVEEELLEAGVAENTLDRLFDLLLLEEEFEDTVYTLRNTLTSDLGKTGLQEIEEFYKAAKIFECEKLLRFRPSLARGLEIYTGTVFEVFHKNLTISSSLAAGGRYDEIIGSFLNAANKRKYPAVGISFGLDVIYDLLIELKSEEGIEKSVTQVAVMPFDETVARSLKLVNDLRNIGVNTDYLPTDIRLKHRFKWANRYKTPFVIIAGAREAENNQFTLKTMKTGEEQKLTHEEIVNFFKISKN